MQGLLTLNVDYAELLKYIEWRNNGGILNMDKDNEETSKDDGTIEASTVIRVLTDTFQKLKYSVVLEASEHVLENLNHEIIIDQRSRTVTIK